MAIRAITEVHEHVLGFRKRCLTDPICAFATHVGKQEGLSVHPLCHVMASDAGECATVFWQFG